MKKLLWLFTLLLFVSVHSHAFEKKSTYSIKLGTYKYLQNAVNFQEKINFRTFIYKTKNFYGVYAGYFKDKKLAKRVLKKIGQKYKDAYVTIVTVDDKIVRRTTKIMPTKILKQSGVPKKKDYFLVGKNYYQSGDYESALAAFDHLLIYEPNNQLARLEYARTLYMLGLYKASKKEFDIVLASNPPQIVKKNIHAYLQKIAAFSRKHIFYGSVGVGLSYDDNLGYTTHKETTTYGSLTLQNDTNKTKGFFETFSLGLNHLYVTDTFNWSNALYSYNEFQNEDIDNLNFLNFTTALSKNYRQFNISLPLSMSYIWLDAKSYSSSYAVTPMLGYAYDKTTNYKLSLKYQETKTTEDANRDYHTYGTKLSYVKLYNKATIYLNGAVEKDERETTVRYDVSKERVLLSASFFYDVVQNSSFGIGYAYNADRYTTMDEALGYKREDTKTTLFGSFKQSFSKKSFATLGYQHLTNDSNINSYCYDKNSYSLSYWHTF